MAIPKRSYWLREVVTEAGTSYHISFRDGQGTKNFMTIGTVPSAA